MGKYAIGESRDFYSHHGTISDQLVNVVECPPVRDEQQSGGASYYNSLEKLISSLEGSMQHVVIVVKYTHLGFNAFKLNRNYFCYEMLNCRKIFI